MLTLALLLPMVLALSSCSIVKYELRVGVYDELSEDGTALSGTVAMLMLSDDGKTVSYLRLDRVELGAGLTEGKAGLTACTVEGDRDESAWIKDARKLEQHAEGKSLDEVLGMSDDEIAALGISISPASLRGAIASAASSPHRKIMREKGKLDCGVAISVTTSASWDGSISVACDIAGVAMRDGIVEGAIIDSWVPSIIGVTDDTQTLIGASISTAPSKLALYDSYKMAEVSSIKTEWYAQAQTFADNAVGKSPAELINMPISMQDDPNQDPADAVAGCTIKVADYKAPLITAAKRAR